MIALPKNLSYAVYSNGSVIEVSSDNAEFIFPDTIELHDCRFVSGNIEIVGENPAFSIVSTARFIDNCNVQIEHLIPSLNLLSGAAKGEVHELPLVIYFALAEKFSSSDCIFVSNGEKILKLGKYQSFLIENDNIKHSIHSSTGNSPSKQELTEKYIPMYKEMYWFKPPAYKPLMKWESIYSGSPFSNVISPSIRIPELLVYLCFLAVFACILSTINW